MSGMHTKISIAIRNPMSIHQSHEKRLYTGPG